MRQKSLPGIRRLARDALAEGGSLGLHLRGVVVQVYAYDYVATAQDQIPLPDLPPVAVYVDVLVYSGVPNLRSFVVSRALVLQSYAGRHEGSTTLPRAAKLPDGVDSWDKAAGTDLAQLDGDHVVLGFFDSDFSLPFVLGFLPHPTLDDGQAAGEVVGMRLRVSDVSVDGRTHLEKRNGAVVGVDAEGRYVIDLTKAHAGAEPPPANPGGGDVQVKLVGAHAVVVQVDGGASFRVESSGANAILTLGNGVDAAVVASKMQALYDAFKAAYDGHTHAAGSLTAPSGGGPLTGDATAGPSATAPDWASENPTSARLLIPSG